MSNYERPSIVELGSVEDLTRGSGSAHRWDSNYPGVFGFAGVIIGNGGVPDNPGVS